MLPPPYLLPPILSVPNKPYGFCGRHFEPCLLTYTGCKDGNFRVPSLRQHSPLLPFSRLRSAHRPIKQHIGSDPQARGFGNFPVNVCEVSVPTLSGFGARLKTDIPHWTSLFTGLGRPCIPVAMHCVKKESLLEQLPTRHQATFSSFKSKLKTFFFSE